MSVHDTHLVTRIRAGDEAAFAALYDRYCPVVYGVALRVLRDQAAAEDLVQEIFLQFWQRPESFDAARGHLAPWLSVVARNRAIDRIRRHSNQREVGELPDMPSANLEASLVNADLVARVKTVVQQLPSEQQKALAMSYLDGFTHAEIAAQTGEPLGTIKGRIRAAVAALRKTLGT